ncbi:MAG: hypothetical protein WCR21_08065 [Bacteroidota bacterium]
MKKVITYSFIAASALWMMSCGSAKTTLQKDIKYMSLHFKPLSRNDFTLVGNLQSETTVGGVFGAPNPTTKERPKILSGTYAANIKQGRSAKTEVTEIMYFAPSNGEAITGSLYDNDIFNTIYSSASVGLGVAAKKPGSGGLIAKLLSNLKVKTTTAVIANSDPARDYAFFGLIEKYPDIDYFINVRFDRKTVVGKGGKSWIETVTCKADGIKLKTD